MKRAPLRLILVLLAANFAAASVHKIGDDLYAYISENDSSANATFLVGDNGVLVVDTGLNSREGEKLLAEIRKISAAPVRWIVNTHYHPDHRGGNAVVGPDAMVISTDYTRQRVLGQEPTANKVDATGYSRNVVVSAEHGSLNLFVGRHEVKVYNPGPAHTMGDLVVYFPNDRMLATGDLFLNNSCPAMDQGSLENWIAALDRMLQLPLDHVVPGHFELAGRDQLKQFRDYLSDLQQQVLALYRSGATLEQIKKQLKLEKYRNFRQFPRYEATFGDNAAAYYSQLEAEGKTHASHR